VSVCVYVPENVNVSLDIYVGYTAACCVLYRSVVVMSVTIQVPDAR